MPSPKTDGPRQRKGKPKEGSGMTLSDLKGRLPTGTGELTVKLRAKGPGEYKVVAPGTPLDEIDLSEIGFLNDNHKHHHHHHYHPESWRTWLFGRKFFFPAGILLGLVLALTLTPLSNIPPEIFDSLSGGEAGEGSTLSAISQAFSNLKLPAWADIDLKELTSNVTVFESAKKVLTSRDFQIGSALLERGMRQHHPVILVPGIVSTGLESWSTKEEHKSFFRKRLWGTTTMIQAVLSDKARWIAALSLDPVTGLDPEGYKVRAASGLDAASEFIQGYWVWQKVVQNLAALGYDPNSLEMAAYDWRLSYYNLEIRDAYFSRLMAKIELFKKQNGGRKVILCSHSMGGSVVMYFLKWVEAMPSDDIDGHAFGGGGGPGWVDDHIEAFVNMAGTLLGVSKAMTAFLSGEMRDTVEVNPAASWVLEKMFSRKERANLFRNWPGSASMWLKGGDRIWGDINSAPDDPDNATDTHGRFFSFRNSSDLKSNNDAESTWGSWLSSMTQPATEPTGSASAESEEKVEAKKKGLDTTTSDKPKGHELNEYTVRPNLTMAQGGDYVLMHSPSVWQQMMQANYSNAFETDVKKLKENGKDHRKWANPLEVQLPNAPSMKIYCLYGVGKETERSYWYMQGEYERDDAVSDGANAQCQTADEIDPSNATTSGTTCRTPLDLPLLRKNFIDSAVSIKDSIPEVRSGVKFGLGDGTVPLLSLGAMCVEGWKRETWNPAGIEVITHEFKHEPEALDLRGGAKTGDHIDVLGSTGLNEAVALIAAGEGHRVKNKLVSPIKKFVAKIDWS